MPDTLPHRGKLESKNLGNCPKRCPTGASWRVKASGITRNVAPPGQAGEQKHRELPKTLPHRGKLESKNIGNCLKCCPTWVSGQAIPFYADLLNIYGVFSPVH